MVVTLTVVSYGIPSESETKSMKLRFIFLEQKKKKQTRLIKITLLYLQAVFHFDLYDTTAYNNQSKNELIVKTVEIVLLLVYIGKKKTCGSITLIKGRHNILVDTGSPWEKDLLLQGTVNLLYLVFMIFDGN